MSWLVVAAASVWRVVPWAIRLPFTLPFDLLRFPFRSFSGLVLGLLGAAGAYVALTGPLASLDSMQRWVAILVAAFIIALLVEWRGLARRKDAGAAWLRFLVGWAIALVAAWLAGLPVYEKGLGALLRADRILVLVLAWLLLGAVLRSTRLAGELTRIWREEAGRRQDAMLLRRLRIEAAPPSSQAYLEWYAWASSELGGRAAAGAAGAALAALTKGADARAAAAAARGVGSGVRAALQDLQERWAAAMAAASNNT